MIPQVRSSYAGVYMYTPPIAIVNELMTDLHYLDQDQEHNIENLRDCMSSLVIFWPGHSQTLSLNWRALIGVLIGRSELPLTIILPVLSHIDHLNLHDKTTFSHSYSVKKIRIETQVKHVVQGPHVHYLMCCVGDSRSGNCDIFIVWDT